MVRYLRFIQMDCLQLAVDCGCQEFVSHRLAQKTLEAIWAGNQDDNTANLVELKIKIYFVRLNLKS